MTDPDLTVRWTHLHREHHDVRVFHHQPVAATDDGAVADDAGWVDDYRDAAQRKQVRRTSSACTPTIKKGKGRYSSSWEPYLRATGRHLPYEITQCYLLLPDTSECVPPNPSHTGCMVLDLPTPEGWKAELT